VESGFATIARAHQAASASISEAGKRYHRDIADDETNRLGALLRVRWPGPVVPGKPVPPTIVEIRTALAAYRAIGRAMVAALEAESALEAEWSERAAITAWDLEQQAAELRRCYPHGL